jgi:hypothetical protein
MLEKLS